MTGIERCKEAQQANESSKKRLRMFDTFMKVIIFADYKKEWRITNEIL